MDKDVYKQFKSSQIVYLYNNFKDKETAFWKFFYVIVFMIYN